jgi:hypothetical protein
MTSVSLCFAFVSSSHGQPGRPNVSTDAPVFSRPKDAYIELHIETRPMTHESLFLIDNAYPTKSDHFFSPVVRPTKLEYKSVLALCRKVNLTCTEAHIPFEEDETGIP